ncbi:unnamed protein product [Ixodes hexagonus]
MSHFLDTTHFYTRQAHAVVSHGDQAKRLPVTYASSKRHERGALLDCCKYTSGSIRLRSDYTSRPRYVRRIFRHSA